MQLQNKGHPASDIHMQERSFIVAMKAPPLPQAGDHRLRSCESHEWIPGLTKLVDIGVTHHHFAVIGVSKKRNKGPEQIIRTYHTLYTLTLRRCTTPIIRARHQHYYSSSVSSSPMLLSDSFPSLLCELFSFSNPHVNWSSSGNNYGVSATSFAVSSCLVLGCLRCAL